MLRTVSNAASSDASPPLRVIGRPWVKGESGNPNGRPKSPVDIAELARQYGPRCIEVAVELLDDADPRIRLAALIALLDRGFGRPAQAVSSATDMPTLTLQHLVAARTFGAELAAERAAMEQHPTVINGEATTLPDDKQESAPRSLFEPALE
jgi:hypothetical protein